MAVSTPTVVAFSPCQPAESPARKPEWSSSATGTSVRLISTVMVASDVWFDSQVCCDFEGVQGGLAAAQLGLDGHDVPDAPGPVEQLLDPLDASCLGTYPDVVVDDLGGHVFALARRRLEVRHLLQLVERGREVGTGEPEDQVGGPELTVLVARGALVVDLAAVGGDD